MSEIFVSTIRLAVPLVFAAYGGLLSEKSGIANIALEANLLVAAFVSAAVTTITENLFLGMSAGICASACLGLLFSLLCIYGRGDQIVIGTAINILITGALPVFNKVLFGVASATPSLPLNLRFISVYGFVSSGILVMLTLHFLFSCTRFGNRIIAAGENPMALTSQGVSHHMVQIKSVLGGSLLTGIGGVYLSLCQGSGYVREMAAGRGFIALAALIFGAWKPIPTFAACLLFAFMDAIQIQNQGKTLWGIIVPSQFAQILPYVVALSVLTFYARRISPPQAINQQ